MGATEPTRRQSLARRLRSGPRSPTDDDQAQLDATMLGWHPRFWPAVVADARITARYRGERHRFGSRAEALAQVVRLAWVTESFFAQVCYRARVACRVRGIPVLPTLLHKASVGSAQLVVGKHVVVSPGVYVPHGQVVIDGITAIGAGVVLRPFVTIGLVDGNVIGPRIGDGAHLGTGAKVVGPVVVGADAQIGANAVVLDDVADGATAVGVPARIVDR